MQRYRQGKPNICFITWHVPNISNNNVGYQRAVYGLGHHVCADMFKHGNITD